MNSISSSFSNKKQSEILKLTKETLESSSIHAIPNITRNKFYSIKIIWLVCLLTSSGYCGFFVSKSIGDFLDYDVTTKTQIKYVNKILFPIVSICDLNSFGPPLPSQIAQKVYNSIRETNGSYENKVIYTRAKTKLYMDKMKYHKTSYGYKLDEIVIKCIFAFDNCNLTNDFEYFYDNIYGACYRFNSGVNMLDESTDRKYVSKNGIWNGLSIEFFIGNLNDNQNYLSQSNGFNIFISSEPLDSDSNEGINLSPGTSTKIILKKFTQTKQPKPYSECTNNLNSIDSFNSDCFRKTMMLNKTNYRYDTCYNICLQKFVADNCNCQYFDMNVVYYDNMKWCEIENDDIENITKISNDSDCAYDNWINYMSSNEKINNFDCPIECEYNGYNYISSTAQFPTKKYFEFELLNNSVINSRLTNVTFENVRESVARVDIFFDSLRETFITENVKMSTTDLVSNIGGLFGLFLGNLKIFKIFKIVVFSLKVF